MEYEAVIGLEVHTQLITRSKMFCGCPNAFGGEPNTRVCPVCLGYPGVLPVINREAVRKTLMAGRMCDCDVDGFSKFDRKNYFYPDMPKNYQLSQYDLPLCRGGAVPVGGTGFSGAAIPAKDIRLTRMHLEEDTGKLTHAGAYSVVDFNRAGIPLLEIVTEPDLRSADEAYAFLTGLKQLMQYAGVSDCDMEKGQMRCDVNVSVRPRGQQALGDKVEIKNLNSFRAVHRALEYEIERQVEDLEDGAAIVQQTRGWDDDAGTTFVQRSKEDAHDYRYFPEPDLLPIEVSVDWVAAIDDGLPERPLHRHRRFMADYGLTEYDADVLTADKALADYFEAAALDCPNPKAAANWVITELSGALTEAEISLAECCVTPQGIAQLVTLIEDGTISGKMAKEVFADMFGSAKLPRAIVEEKGLRQVTDEGAIEELVERAVAENPRAVAEFRGGKKKALQFLVGQVMKFSRGKANPAMVVQTLTRRMSE